MVVCENWFELCYLCLIIWVGLEKFGVVVKGNMIYVVIVVWLWGVYFGEDGFVKGICVKMLLFMCYYVNVLMVCVKVLGWYVNLILVN